MGAALKCTASIGWLSSPCGVIRLHDDGGAYGDAYDWCCTVEAIGSLAIMHGTLTAPSASQFRAMADILRDSGFTRVQWVRMGKRTVEWEL